MINHLIQFFGKLSFLSLLFIIMPLVLASSVLIIRRTMMHPVLKSVLYFIAIVFLIRVCLFYNPIAWAAYKKIMPLKSNDWRHFDVMLYETNKYLKPNKNLKYLAVGSSQTHDIYENYASQHNDFSLFTMAGLSPLDLYTYRKEIVRQNPEYVLLYLSEFDIAREPSLESSKWSPFSLHDMFELLSVIDTIDYFSKQDKQIFYELFFGKYFPEYKYSFVFKDFTDKLLNKNRLLSILSPFEIPDSVYLKMQLKSLNDLSAEYIPFNMFYLKKALYYLNTQHIKVIIVEGQYHPLAYKPNNIALNKQVNAFLKDLAHVYPGNVFLSREEEPNFVIDDYTDGYHVNEKAGLEFSEHIVNRLNNNAL
jgi:hypothetical protein